jgi:hypothetical protein
LDRGGFACALGGPDRTTLFIVAAKWRGTTEPQMVSPGSGRMLISDADVPGRVAVTPCGGGRRRHAGVNTVAGRPAYNLEFCIYRRTPNLPPTIARNRQARLNAWTLR